MAAVQPLDTTIAVVTPENIAFEYQLAGPFRRLPAYLIDLAVRWGVILTVGFTLLLVGGLLTVLSSFYGPLTFAFIVILIFVINWFYGTILEAYFNGRTIGKWFCGIRVIEVDGRPVSPRSALLRNLLRVADLAPVAAINTWDPDVPPIYFIPTGIVGLVSMMMTQRMQRLGDLAAGTMVVVDERKWQLPIAKVDDARVPALASYIPGDYLITRKMARTLATYVERRHFLTPPRRREVARNLSDPLIDRFDFRKDIDPDLLLYALYYKTFLVDSTTESADLGPLAGYSPLAKDAGKPSGLAEPLQSVVQEELGKPAQRQPAQRQPVQRQPAQAPLGDWRSASDRSSIQPNADAADAAMSSPSLAKTPPAETPVPPPGNAREDR
ncbi:RDD family protein [Stieleria maiorica]|uniref:RDD family protein n=1 Tax=Stieleria maiorica TaxID=2795974 RepID=A0A5B9MHE4_9BACT|nr:RDD family protein [Stieleria maiorica]QEF99410.1 RDD family protein [Stieleria maiorica]